MTTPNTAHLIALLHRAHTALRWPKSAMDREKLIEEIGKVVLDAYPRPPRTHCWCSEPAVDGQQCNNHTEFETGDG